MSVYGRILAGQPVALFRKRPRLRDLFLTVLWHLLPRSPSPGGREARIVVHEAADQEREAA